MADSTLYEGGAGRLIETVTPGKYDNWKIVVDGVSYKDSHMNMSCNVIYLGKKYRAVIGEPFLQIF